MKHKCTRCFNLLTPTEAVFASKKNPTQQVVSLF